MTREKFKQEFDAIQSRIEHKEQTIKLLPRRERGKFRKVIDELSREAKKLDRQYYQELIDEDEETWWVLFSRGFINPKTDKEKDMIAKIYNDADEFFNGVREKKGVLHES